MTPTQTALTIMLMEVNGIKPEMLKQKDFYKTLGSHPNFIQICETMDKIKELKTND